MPAVSTLAEVKEASLLPRKVRMEQAAVSLLMALRVRFEASELVEIAPEIEAMQAALTARSRALLTLP